MIDPYRTGVLRLEINSNIKDDIFDFCYGMAIEDATKRVSKKHEKGWLEKNTDIKEIVKDYADSIISNTARESLYDISKRIQEKDNNIEKLTFGKIQKLVNMTMKYLYIRYYDCKSIKKRFAPCDAPMDGAMIAFVYESYHILMDNMDSKNLFNRECAWSKIDFGEKVNSIEDYEKYQCTIQAIITKAKLNINRIEFDYMCWNKAKQLQDKIREEQRKEIKEFWERVGVKIHEE